MITADDVVREAGLVGTEAHRVRIVAKAAHAHGMCKGSITIAAQLHRGFVDMAKVLDERIEAQQEPQRGVTKAIRDSMQTFSDAMATLINDLSAREQDAAENWRSAAAQLTR